MNYNSILITGCSSGFGYLSALETARNGYKTYATVRDLNSIGAKNLKEIVLKENLPLEVMVCDTTKQETINSLPDVDVLVNNAGYGYFGPLEETSIEDIKIQYETNVFGTLRMIKKMLPRMRENHKGLIINVSSIAGLIPFPLYGAYSSSKFAVESITETFSHELDKFGIKVVLIEPGMFKTNFTKNRKIVSEYNETTSPYKNLMANFTKRLKTRGISVIPAEQPSVEFPKLLLKILNTDRPNSRYKIGKDAVWYPILKALMPQKLWHFVIRKVYNW